VLVVQVERQSYFVPTGPAEGESCPCRCGGIVDLSRNDKREWFGVDRHWMSVRRSMRSETVKSGCDGHGGDLREKWIHGGTTLPGRGRKPERSNRSNGWRLETTSPEEYRSGN
jgi:hypothetical protein